MEASFYRQSSSTNSKVCYKFKFKKLSKSSAQNSNLKTDMGAHVGAQTFLESGMGTHVGAQTDMGTHVGAQK